MNIYDLDIEKLTSYIEEIGEKKYRANQIFSWLHNKNISELDNMTDINKSLIEKIEIDFNCNHPTIIEKYMSKIDDTIKYLIKLQDGNIIETVLMKYKYGFTLCISSQVGCNMGCKFCASTLNGLVRNLEINELLWQVYAVDKELYDRYKQKISHIVIMGAGEPLNNIDNIISFLNIINNKKGKNLSLRNITISTCGILEKIELLSQYNFPITLALSLHAPNNEIRKKIMPIANKYDIEDLIKAMAEYYKITKRQITFEYTMIDNVNDSIDNAKELSDLLLKYLHKSDFNINLILINEIKESNFKRPKDDNVKNFIKILNQYGINNTLRRELGKDISGSCGQLRHKYIKELDFS